MASTRAGPVADLDQFFAEGDAENQAMIDTILVDLSDDPGERAVIRRRAQALAQALIRSDPGWRFIKLLAEKMLTLKHGSLKHHGVAAIFRQAFGRPPPDSNAWNNHWPPTLQRVRVGSPSHHLANPSLTGLPPTPRCRFVGWTVGSVRRCARMSGLRRVSGGNYLRLALC